MQSPESQKISYRAVQPTAQQIISEKCFKIFKEQQQQHKKDRNEETEDLKQQETAESK
jgi:hypothetical protein